MGHEEEKELIVQLPEKVKRKHLLSIIRSHLETSKNMVAYFTAIATTDAQKKVCKKSMKSLNKALKHIDEIKHIEILEYLYSTFIGNNVIAYTISGEIVNSKKVNEYDKDENIEEFRQLMLEQRQEQLERERKRQESAEVIKKAKEQGKKVEMVWDKDTKTAKPMIIEEKSNS